MNRYSQSRPRCPLSANTTMTNNLPHHWLAIFAQAFSSTRHFDFALLEELIATQQPEAMRQTRPSQSLMTDLPFAPLQILE